MADYDLQYQDTHIDALLATANELKTAGYIYKGVATPSTNPGTPTERVAYLASEPGTYTNFGGIVITSGLYSLTYASGTWTATQMQAGSDIEVVQTTGQSTSDVMSQKAVTDEIINLYASSIWTTSTDNAIRNGSVGNAGNPQCVAVTKIIDVSNLKSLKLVTNRPNSDNCVYRWIYSTFSITTGNSNNTAARIRNFGDYNAISYPTYFEFQEGEVGFAFGLLEWNTVTNTASALRLGNFSGYVIGFEGVEKKSKCDYPVLQEGTALTLDLFKMNVGSIQPSGIIATLFSGSYTSFPIEVAGIHSITVSKPTVTLEDTEYIPQLRIVEFDTIDCTNGTMVYNANPTGDYVFTPTKKYIKIHLSFSTSGYDLIYLRKVFDGLHITSDIPVKVLNIPTRQLPTFQFKDVVYIPSPAPRLGSVGNLGNAYAVSTTFVIPTYDYKYAMIYTSYKPQDGCILRYTCDLASLDRGKSEEVARTNRIIEAGYANGYNNMVAETKDAKGISFSIVEYNPNTDTYTNREDLRNALNEEHFGVILFNDEASISNLIDKSTIVNASVTNLNNAHKLKDVLAQVTRYPRVGQTLKTKPLSLLHFSDMHGSAAALRRIIAFKNEWTSYIDDILDTGDTIYTRYSDDWTWFTAIEGSENILMTIGNHDALAATTGYDWTNLITPQQGYERYMAGIENWGVTYQVNKTYYYKNYSTEKIRLIVLDCMLWDSTQLEWLTNTLASAKTAGLAVVCVSHYPPLMDGLDNCSFNSPRETNDYVNSDALIAVDNFMTNGGHFACWVCGHVHNDKFGTVKDYPNQTVVGVDTCATDDANLAYSDVARVDRTKSQDLFNIISFDTWNKRIKILRIGADYDFMMRHKGTLCWDYANQKLLWNT